MTPASDEQTLHARSPRNSVFPDEDVQAALNAMRVGGIPQMLETWQQMDRAGAGGRPAVLSLEALLVAMLLLRNEQAPQLTTELSNVFYQRLSPASREALGLGAVRRADTWKVESQKWYDRAEATLHRLLALVDPYPARRQLMNTAERDYQRSLRDADTMALRRARLDWLCNAILDMSIRELPEHARAAWQGDISIDQTKLPAVSSRGRRAWKRKNGVGQGAEPDSLIMEMDADWYNHAPDYRGQDDGRERARANTWGYALNIAVMVPSQPTNDPAAPLPFPTLAVGMKLSTPIVDNVADDTVAMLASIVDRGYPAGRVTGDKDYFAKQKPENLALPVRALGYSPVTDYRVADDDRHSSLGVQGHVGGALIVEGRMYCPAMPTGLVNATKDRNAGKISDDIYLRRVEEQRPLYEVQRKEKPDEHGAYPVQCPALGLSPTVTCPLRRINPKAADRARPDITRPPAHPDRICTMSSVKVAPDHNVRYLQHLRYGTREWRNVYGSDRSDIERYNSIIKDKGKENLENTALRRTRGFAAAALFAALAMASANRRLIRTWAKNEATKASSVEVRRRTKSPTSLQNYRPRLPLLTPAATDAA